MSWQTTLVEPVSPDRPTFVTVACTWCPWRSMVVDVSTEHGREAVRRIRLAHVCALKDPDRAFADIVECYDDATDLYAAVVRIEQEHPDDLPVIIGMRAWALLDEEQQRKHFHSLLQAYVEIVRRDRAEEYGETTGDSG